MCLAIQYKVTAIVSVYKAERFLRACLEDLVQQTIFSDTEVIIIDACSPENEQAIALEFSAKYPNIQYVRTPVRETLYAAWNRGIRMAKGEYITNANADDRHAPNAFERLASELDARKDVALVYADCRVTSEENALFATAPIKRFLHWSDYDHISLLCRCEIGPQPMWRRSVHDDVGFFDESYTVAGDYDMWLRISERYSLYHVQEELGLYLEYDNNLETQNPQRSYDEEYSVKTNALQRFMQQSFVPHTPLLLQLRIHSAKLAQLLEAIKNEEQLPNIHKIEFQFFAYALLAAKNNDMSTALEIIELFFTLIHNSKNVCHLYRFLLLTSPGAVAGTLRHELAPAESPLVSVIIPLYNQGHFLEQALVSVLAQTQTRFEVCIVNDGSTDTSLSMAKQLLAKYNDPRIKIVSHANSGKGFTRNRGVKETTAPFICILDADDMLVPTYFTTALAMLENQPDIGWVCPKSLVFGNNNHITWSEPYDFFRSLLQCPCPVTAIYRRNLWEDLNGYVEDMHDREDWDFWVRAGERGWTGLTSPKVEFIYRHIFMRFGEIPRNNIKSKQDYISRHPWWFKQLSPPETKAMLTAYSVGILPEEILNEAAVETVRPFYGNKKAFMSAVAQLQAGTLPLTSWKDMFFVDKYPPGHFYSPLPSREEIKRVSARVFSQQPTEFAGIDINEQAQKELYFTLVQHAQLWPYADNKIQNWRYYPKNDYFSYSDGFYLFTMLHHLQPQRIVEIGSGFSSCIMLDVNEKFFNQSMNITFIEPFPDRLLQNMKQEDAKSVTLLKQFVQDVDIATFTSLQAGDILFIDSSHVAKIGSDVLYIFQTILPLLAEGVIIHIHDIFYPFEYPQAWYEQAARAWNECHFLRAFLQYNTAFEILLFVHMFAHNNKALLHEHSPICLQNTGGSFWMRKKITE